MQVTVIGVKDFDDDGDVGYTVRIGPSADLVFTTFRLMPTANANGKIEPEGSVGVVSVRCVLRCLQIKTGPGVSLLAY